MLYWLFIGALFTWLIAWFVRRCIWVRQLRRDRLGPSDHLDLWIEVLINGKP